MEFDRFLGCFWPIMSDSARLKNESANESQLHGFQFMEGIPRVNHILPIEPAESLLPARYARLADFKINSSFRARFPRKLRIPHRKPQPMMHESVRKVLAGDTQAFREIVREYGPTVRMLLFSRLKDPHLVEDLSQEIFVAAYRALESYDPDRDFRTWLSSIAKNKLMSHLRTQYSRKNSVNVLTVDIHELLLPALDDCNSDAEAVCAQLLTCIGKHPEKDRLLIDARYFEEESVISIAERLRTSVSAISSNLYRIRAQLRQCIEESPAL